MKLQKFWAVGGTCRGTPLDPPLLGNARRRQRVPGRRTIYICFVVSTVISPHTCSVREIIRDAKLLIAVRNEVTAR